MVLMPKHQINPRTVGRLSIYRRVLSQLFNEGTARIFSRDLAKMAGVSPSQVRQDLMNVPTNGTPQNGYSVSELTEAVISCLGSSQTISVVLLGAGHLGQALLHYFQATEPHLEMKAVFEVDSNMVGKHLLDVPVLHVSMLEIYLKLSRAPIAVLALPPEEAQNAADQLVASGVCSILNFTPCRLQVPDHVFVENNDIQMSLERVGFYANHTITDESRA
jgi:redox-sensing transcriptional repressor